MVLVQVRQALQTRFINVFKDHSVVVIGEDYYYKNQSHLEFEERLETNYDHPFAFDTDLLNNSYYTSFIKRESIEKPIYNYSYAYEIRETVIIEPKDVIILEGILVLEDV